MTVNAGIEKVGRFEEYPEVGWSSRVTGVVEWCGLDFSGCV